MEKVTELRAPRREMLCSKFKEAKVSKIRIKGGIFAHGLSELEGYQESQLKKKKKSQLSSLSALSLKC